MGTGSNFDGLVAICICAATPADAAGADVGAKLRWYTQRGVQGERPCQEERKPGLEADGVRWWEGREC